nr:uncharacterized protein LOC110355771 [Columba livia]
MSSCCSGCCPASSGLFPWEALRLLTAQLPPSARLCSALGTLPPSSTTYSVLENPVYTGSLNTALRRHIRHIDLHRLQQCKGISITISASGLFGHRSVLLPLPLLQYGLTSHSLFRGVTCRSLDLSMATDALRCTCSTMDLSTATGTSGCPPPTWTYPQVTVPSSQVGTGAPACPAQQHRHSSDALATGQPRHMATAVIKMLPGTAG